MTTGKTQELEIKEMKTTSSLPAKPDDLADIEPILAEVRNQQTGEFEKVMISPHDIQKYICPTATLPELYIFMSICRQQGIDPISEAYFVKFGSLPGFTVMKYTVYLKRAMQSGVLKSIRHEFDDEENPTKIMVYIERNDMEGEWVWTTYRSEVEKRRNKDNKVTEIWDTQLRFMMTKCGYSQALRFFCADVVGALPPTQEEMPGIGALNIQQPMTGVATGMLAEQPGDERLAGEVLEVESVEPLPEHLDMGPLRVAFHELISGKFADDDARHKWQMQHTGIASMKEWGPAEYAKAFKALSKEGGAPNGSQDQDQVVKPEATEAEGDIDAGRMSDAAITEVEGDREEQAEGLTSEQIKTAADPRYHSGPDTNIGAQTKEEQGKTSETKPETVEATFRLEAAKRFATPEALDKWIHKVSYKKIPIKEWETEHFQKALPALMEVPLLKDQKENDEEPVTQDDKPVEDAVEEAVREGTLEVAKSHFLDMLLERYPNIEDRMKWIAENIPAPINEMDTWEHHHFEHGIKLLSEMSYPTKEPAPEPDNDAGDYGLVITPKTKASINAALLDFPGKKYGTIRTSAFREMAYKAIDHDYTLYSKILNSDGRLILAALIEEESEILLANMTSESPLDENGDRLEDGTLTPVDAQEEADSQDAFVKEQMEKAKGMGVPESVTDIIEGKPDEESRGDLLESYLEKAGERFADKAARKAWERGLELPFDLSIAKWPESETKRGYAMLEGVTKLTDVPSGEPLMNDGQLGEMQGKIGDMHERFHGSLGSQPFLDLVFKVTTPERKMLKDLTEAEAAEVIMQMADAVGTEKARKATAAKTAE